MSAIMERDAANLLVFQSDISVRYRWFSAASFGHPAKLHLGLLQWIIDRYTQPGQTILDPMAGSGSILLAATQQRDVIARDVEPRFLALMHENAAYILRTCGLFAGQIAVGAHDARQPWGVSVDHIIMSPPYGCKTGVSATAQKGMLTIRAQSVGLMPHHKRWDQLNAGQHGALTSLRFHYGEHPAQVGHLRNAAYWEAMRAIYRQAYHALRPGGLMILVIKDHIKAGQRVRVAEDTVLLCQALGFTLIERHARLVYPLSLWQRRRKEKGLPVVEDEAVLALRRDRL